jgi:hypothetical protein
VNSRGHVRRTGSNQKLIPERGLIGNVVKLWHKGDPKKFKTSDLVQTYFPELQEGGAPLVWKTLKDFPDYEGTVIGSIRNRSTRYELPIKMLDGEAKVALWKDGVKKSYSITDLIESAFSSEVKSEA